MIGKSTTDRQKSKQAMANGSKARPLLTSLGLTHIYGAVGEQKSNQHIHEAILYVQNASDFVGAVRSSRVAPGCMQTMSGPSPLGPFTSANTPVLSAYVGGSLAELPPHPQLQV